jgi:hypothetical protein
LLKVDDDIHKGLGRLVYLFYFDKMSISSKYDHKHCTFTYDNEFDGALTATTPYYRIVYR